MLTDLDSVNPNHKLPQNTTEEKRRRPGANSNLQVYMDQQNLERWKGRWRDTERRVTKSKEEDSEKFKKTRESWKWEDPQQRKQGATVCNKEQEASRKEQILSSPEMSFSNEPNVLNICLQKRGKNNHELKLY